MVGVDTWKVKQFSTKYCYFKVGYEQIIEGGTMLEFDIFTEEMLYRKIITFVTMMECISLICLYSMLGNIETYILIKF